MSGVFYRCLVKRAYRRFSARKTSRENQRWFPYWKFFRVYCRLHLLLTMLPQRNLDVTWFNIEFPSLTLSSLNEVELQTKCFTTYFTAYTWHFLPANKKTVIKQNLPVPQSTTVFLASNESAVIHNAAWCLMWVFQWLNTTLPHLYHGIEGWYSPNWRTPASSLKCQSPGKLIT